MRHNKFSDAERMAVCQIIKRHNYIVSRACVDECRRHLGKPITDRTLRNWKDALIAPKPSPGANKGGLTEFPQMLPTSAETPVADGPGLPKVDLSGLTRIEKLDLAINPRVERLVERIQDMSDASLVKQVADLMEARRRELGIPTAVMDALSQLGRLQALILRAIDRGDLPPGETLRSYLAAHCDRLEAGGIERPVIELEIPMIIQPMAAAVPVSNGYESNDDATTV